MMNGIGADEVIHSPHRRQSLFGSLGNTPRLCFVQKMPSEKHPRRNFIGDHKWKNGQHSNLERFWRELDQVCKSVKQECRKAQYLYLKGELLQGANFEVNQDKNTVIGYLQSLAFSPTLVASLEKAEELYRSAASTFDLKSSMGHLRSFLENLHIDAAKLLHSKVSTTAPLPPKWGEAILFLKQQSVLTQKEEEMIGAFYTVVSDKAIHPLVAERICKADAKYCNRTRLVSFE
jgi:hypothetical protein